MIWNKLASVLFVVLLASVASGQTWMELVDAPDGVPDNQVTIGPGPITAIQGVLDRTSGDHVDTYCIKITDPFLFYASTSPHLGGSLGANDRLADSRLWLWTHSLTDGMSNILLGNDNDAFTPNDPASTLADPDQFTQLTGGEVHPTASNVVLEAGEVYLLSISTVPNNPRDATGMALTPMGEPGFNPTLLYGPDPDAGPFFNWENQPTTDAGPYLIALQGVAPCLVPEPIAGVTILATICWLGLFRRNRVHRR